MREIKRFKKLTAAGLIALMLSFNIAPALADDLDDLEDEKAVYDQKAQENLEKSNELQAKIDNVSATKRIIDEEAATATAEYRSQQSALAEIESRIEENQRELAANEKELTKKRATLAKRVRDIYINGRVNYVDVLFGATSFSDFLTRMDLLKRIIKRDYDLVQAVVTVQNEIKLTQVQLDKDRELKTSQVALAAQAKQRMDAKVAEQQAIIDRMENDKAVYDQQYEELMAASKEVERLIRVRNFQPGGGMTSGDGSMIWPIAGEVTSEFGWREHPIFGTARFHSGLDLDGDYDEPICAAADGVVIYAGWISGYGNAVIIDHGGGITTLYGHNESLNVSEGESVSQGQVIAFCGSTGNSTGPHCHFEVREDGEPVSPYDYV